MVFIYLLFLYEVKEDGEVELIVFCLHLEVSLRVVAYGADLGSLLADDDVTTVGALYTISCSIKSRVHFRTDPMITKIIAAWKETNWGEPQLLNKLDVDEVELVLPVPSIMGVSDGVSNRVPNGVSDSAKVIFAHIKENPNISRNELANLTGISLKNIQKHINKLKELGLIRRIGSPRLGYWEIVS